MRNANYSGQIPVMLWQRKNIANLHDLQRLALNLPAGYVTAAFCLKEKTVINNAFCIFDGAFLISKTTIKCQLCAMEVH